MRRALRILAGLILTALLLHAATLATRDCATSPYTSENCLWSWLRDRLSLPKSKLLRAAALELVGLALLGGLYLTFRYVLRWPGRGRRSPPHSAESNPTGSEPARE